MTYRLTSRALPLFTEQKVYAWVDEIPLSRPKRNFTRDFSPHGSISLLISLYTGVFRHHVHKDAHIVTEIGELVHPLRHLPDSLARGIE